MSSEQRGRQEAKGGAFECEAAGVPAVRLMRRR